MLPYAKRINFDAPVFVAPCYSYAALYAQQTPKTLLNKDGQFTVHVTEKTPYVKEFVRLAQDLNLSVSGDGTAPVRGGDITNVQKGQFLTVGTSKNFDVNWIKRDEYFANRKLAPVYDIVADWDKCKEALRQFAAAKKNVTLNDGTEIKFHARFMVVDGKVIPYTDKQMVMAVIPATQVRQLVDLYEIQTIRILGRI